MWWIPSSRKKFKKVSVCQSVFKDLTNVIWKLFLRNRVGFEPGTSSIFEWYKFAWLPNGFDWLPKSTYFTGLLTLKLNFLSLKGSVFKWHSKSGQNYGCWIIPKQNDWFQWIWYSDFGSQLSSQMPNNGCLLKLTFICPLIRTTY